MKQCRDTDELLHGRPNMFARELDSGPEQLLVEALTGAAGDDTGD